MTRDEAQALTKKILGYATVPEAAVSVRVTRSGFLRFARNQATTAGQTESASVDFTAWKGKRGASVQGTVEVLGDRLDETALKKIVADAEALAAISPEDREYMPLPGPQKYLEVDAFDEAVASAGPKMRAERAGDAIQYAKDNKIEAAGFLDQRLSYHALANTNELFAYHPSTSIQFSMTARTSDQTGSGYASVQSQSYTSLDVREAAAMAVRKAVASRRPAETRPDAYPAVLEPLAVDDLLVYFGGDLDARSADEGRSVFSAPEGKTRVGEQVFDERLTIRSDPADALVPASPIGPEGFPVGKSGFVEKGVLKTLRNSRWWAAQKERQPGPFANNLIFEGGQKSLNEIIRSTKKGVLVSRCWYIRMLDRQQSSVTGLTRDGTFWIEDGEIARPIKNFRFNESMVRVLGDLEELGQPVRIGRGLIPPVRARSFRFSSISDAV